MQVLDPTQRLGCKEMGGMALLQQHPFFEGVVWEGLENQQPPELMPYLPATERNPELWSNQARVGIAHHMHCFTVEPHRAKHPGTS